MRSLFQGTKQKAASEISLLHDVQRNRVERHHGKNTQLEKQRDGADTYE